MANLTFSPECRAPRRRKWTLTSNLSIPEAILAVLPITPAGLSSTGVVTAVLALLPDVSSESVRTKLSRMAQDPQSTVTVNHRGQYSKAAPTETRSDAERVTDELRRVFNAVIAQDLDITPDGYPRAPGLALVDAVFSANAHYASVEKVIRRVREKFRITNEREFTVEDLLSRLAATVQGAHNLDDSLCTFFENRSYSTRGLHKASQVLIIGRALINLPHDFPDIPFALNTHADYEKINALDLDQRIKFLDRLESALTRHRGMGPATYRYLLLLNGVQVVKPDRMVIGWLSEVLERPEGLISPREAAALLETATSRLQVEGYPFSAIAADHAIWLHHSKRITLHPTDERPTNLPAPRLTDGVMSPSLGSSTRAFDLGERVHRIAQPHGIGGSCGTVVGRDSADRSRLIISWSNPSGESEAPESSAFSVEREVELIACDDGTDHEGFTGPRPDAGSPIIIWPSQLREVLDVVESANAPNLEYSLDNHAKIAIALADHRGETLTTAQMWQIVKKHWEDEFEEGSFLPNDHASGNAGSCWCAENRRNQPLLRRVRRGLYLVL